jgi:DNA-binding NarL/FixJ family response regulator
MIRILIADDHPVVREGLVTILDREPDMRVVGQAANGREAVEQYQQVQPDVTLMDLSMPHLDGYEAMQQIRAYDAAARVVALTTFAGEQDIHRSLHSGALSFILKDASPDALMQCIREVSSGKVWLPPSVAGRLAESLRHAPLTRRERDVLQLLCEGRSNRDIGARLNVAEGTVKIHVNKILVKLRASSRTEAVALALRRGLASIR